MKVQIGPFLTYASYCANIGDDGGPASWFPGIRAWYSGGRFFQQLHGPGVTAEGVAVTEGEDGSPTFSTEAEAQDCADRAVQWLVDHAADTSIIISGGPSVRLEPHNPGFDPVKVAVALASLREAGIFVEERVRSDGAVMLRAKAAKAKGYVYSYEDFPRVFGVGLTRRYKGRTPSFLVAQGKLEETVLRAFEGAGLFPTVRGEWIEFD